MHPHGRISETQERQMTTVLDSNVFNIAIDGTFDDCQRIMKTLFADLDSGTNTCWVRSTPSTGRDCWRRSCTTSMPRSGSWRRPARRGCGSRCRRATSGTSSPGISPARMGLPVGRLVLATNENDILARFFNIGEYRIGQVHETISPSMDIQVASNFERYLYYHVGEDSQRLSDLMTQFSSTGVLTQALGPKGRVDDLIVAGSGDTAGTLATIREFHEEYGYLLDPHSAVGVCVGRRFRDEREPMICLATAHPAKFRETIQRATGRTWAAIRSLMD